MGLLALFARHHSVTCDTAQPGGTPKSTRSPAQPGEAAQTLPTATFGGKDRSAPPAPRLGQADKPAPVAPAPVGTICAEGQAPAVHKLPAAARAKALERLRFVRAVQTAKRDRRLSERDAAQTVAAERAAEFPILCRSGKGGRSALIYNNFRNWSRAIAETADDETALDLLSDAYARGRRKLAGDKTFWEYFHAFYLNLNRLPLAVAYRMAVEKMRLSAPETRIPTLAQARYAVARMDLKTVVMAREGETAARNLCVDFIQRDWSEIPAGYCVVGDSRTFDTRVRVFDEAAQKWRAVRPTVAALIDARSWYFGAWWITTEPVNARTLINTLALYCHNSGGQPPAVAYFDNGKDYCARGFATPLEVEGHEHSIFRELGIRLQNATPYNGRAKTVERVFRDMMQRFDKMFPDYLGSTPEGRNAAADWFDSHAEELPSLQQFCELFDGYISQWHETPKAGRIHGGKSPWEIWEKREPRPAMTPAQLRFAFLRPEGVRQVARGPAVSFDNTFFYCDAVAVGEKVLVKSDPVDPTHVFLFTVEGALRGEARTRDAIRALAGDDEQEALKALIARQRKQLAEARTTIHDLTGGREQVSPLELMLAPIDAKPALLGRKSSVKGPSHTFRRLAMPGAIPAARLEFREDAKEKQLAEFGETAAPKPAEEPTSSKEALSSFNDFMTSRNEEDF